MSVRCAVPALKDIPFIPCMHVYVYTQSIPPTVVRGRRPPSLIDHCWINVLATGPEPGEAAGTALYSLHSPIGAAGLSQRERTITGASIHNNIWCSLITRIYSRLVVYLLSVALPLINFLFVVVSAAHRIRESACVSGGLYGASVHRA